MFFYVLYLGNCIKIHFSEKINCSFFLHVRKLMLCIHIFYFKFQASQLNSQRNWKMMATVIFLAGNSSGELKFLVTNWKSCQLRSVGLSSVKFVVGGKQYHEIMSHSWSCDLQLKNIQFSFKLRSVQSGFQIGGKQGLNVELDSNTSFQKYRS